MAPNTTVERMGSNREERFSAAMSHSSCKELSFQLLRTKSLNTSFSCSNITPECFVNYGDENDTSISQKQQQEEQQEEQQEDKYEYEYDYESLGDPYLEKRREMMPTADIREQSVSTPVTCPDSPSTSEGKTITTETSSSPLPNTDTSTNPPSQLHIPCASPLSHASKQDRNHTSTCVQQHRAYKRKETHERNYFNQLATIQIQLQGTVTISVANTLMMLGNAHLRCREYTEALNVFKSATRIYRQIYHDRHLSVAKALNKVGIAASRIATDVAEIALLEAFKIRIDDLGPYHVDTVDSLNNLASVYLKQHKHADALAAYCEVYLVRQAIFGSKHPSIAITAHAIGGVYMSMSQLEDAARYYQKALNIYQRLKLKADHMNVKQLLNDVAALEKIFENTGEF